jgi:hypothetical protein
MLEAWNLDRFKLAQSLADYVFSNMTGNLPVLPQL